MVTSVGWATCTQSTKRLQAHLPDISVVDYLAWRRSTSIRGIARERIDILLALARKTFPKDRALSKRYVELARLVGMKAGVRLSKEEKMSICRGCGTLLVPGENCRVRTRSELGTTVLITCLDCGAKKRYPSVRERHSRRKS
jgi:ribonuclease P protein subunit RPR2